MFKPLTRFGCSCLMLAVFAVAPARAESEILKVVPKQTLGCIVVNNVQTTSKKLGKIAKTLQVPLPGDAWTSFKTLAGLEAGLDDDGSVVVAMISGFDGAPTPLTIFAVSDKEKFIQSLGEREESGFYPLKRQGETYLVDVRRDYAFMLSQRDGGLFKIIAKQNAAKHLAPVEKVISSSDIAFVATQGGVKLGTASVIEEVARMRKQFGERGDVGEQATAGLKLYEELFKYTQKNVTVAASGVQIDDEGSLRVQSIAKLAGEEVKLVGKTNANKWLNKLPAEPFVFAGSGSTSAESFEQWMALSMELTQYSPGFDTFTPEQRKQLIEINKSYINGLRGMGMAMFVGEKGSPLYSNMAMIAEVDDAAKYLKNYKSSIEAMVKLADEVDDDEADDDEADDDGKVEPIFSTMTVKDTKVAGLQAIELEMKLPIDPQTPGIEELMKGMFGHKDKMKFYLAILDEHHIIGSYVDDALLKKMAKLKKQQRLTKRADLNVANDMLSNKAQWKFFLSPRGTIQWGMRMASASVPVDDLGIPPFPESPAIGVSLTIQPYRVENELVIPAEVLAAIGLYVDLIQNPQN